MPHYPFAHRGNAPFSIFPGSPLVNSSPIVYGVWANNIPSITGFSRVEIDPAAAPLNGDASQMFHPDYPAAAATLAFQAFNKGPQHPGTVRYQYDDTTLPDANWQINSTNRVILITASILPGTKRPRRRNTEMEIKLTVEIGFSVSFSRPFVAFISRGGSRTFERIVTEPAPPTLLRRGRPVYRDYIYTLTSTDITFDDIPSGSSSGSVPASIEDLADEYRDDFVAAVDLWDPSFTLRLFALPYGVSAALTYQDQTPTTRLKVSPGPLF
jgi:hypothetical protein